MTGFGMRIYRHVYSPFPARQYLHSSLWSPWLQARITPNTITRWRGGVLKKKATMMFATALYVKSVVFVWVFEIWLFVATFEKKLA